MGLVGGGGQAEAVVVRQEEALPLPASLSYAEGAAIPEVFFTAYDALVTRGRLAAGERALIHAVGSGVGTAAAQIAKHLGATVIGTSRSATKLARAQAYGVDVGIDTSRTDFEEAVGDPVHVVLDVLGAGALAANLGVLALRGRLVILGLMAGRRGEIDLERGAQEAARDHRERDAEPGPGGTGCVGSGVRRVDAAAVRTEGWPRSDSAAGARANLSDGAARGGARSDGAERELREAGGAVGE